MKVELIAHTPEPEKVIATAAKLCYSSSDISTLADNLTDEKIQSFIEILMSLGHESPVEHVTFTFGIEGISRACSHQLVRHRIASYSQKSQRYVNETKFDYITPPEIDKDFNALVKFDECMEYIQNCYEELRDILTERHKRRIMLENINLTVEEATKIAVKLANEDARFVLPNACETKIIVTMNIRSLYNFFAHRCCNRAQWEIRNVANEMLKLCYQVSPLLFKNAGPNCISSGKCPEGKMTCSKYKEVQEFYKKLKS